MTQLLSPSTARGLRAFAEGFAAPRDGLRYMMPRKHLWQYGWWPVILNVIITLALLGLLVGAGFWFAHVIHPKFSPSWWGIALEVLVVIALILAALALLAIAWVLLQGILCGYFYEKLARRVELELGLPPEQIREVTLGYQIADAFRDTLRLVLVNGGLLLLNFVPVSGSAAALVGSAYINCFTLGEDYFDHPLALRGYRRNEKLAFCRRHRAHTLGLGAAVFLVSFVPVLGSVLLTTAAVGAVLLHRRLTAAPDVTAEPPASPIQSGG